MRRGDDEPDKVRLCGDDLYCCQWDGEVTLMQRLDTLFATKRRHFAGRVSRVPL
jgi:hypothetical protein